MAFRNYPRLDFIPFGKQLIQSGDLDPVYLALNSVSFSKEQRLRWIVAYCAFYHCSVACWLSELKGAEFWHYLKIAAENKVSSPIKERWPRGHERRHFRGEQALAAINDWENRYGTHPEHMMKYIVGSGKNFQAIGDRAVEHRSVGVWMKFKLIDLADACFDAKVEQTNLEQFLYESPRTSILSMWNKLHPSANSDESILQKAIAYLLKQYKELRIPHHPDKAIDLFCLETIACKHSSHLNGHYPLFNDIDEITLGLSSWKDTSASVRLFLEAMPKRERQQRLW